MVRILPKGTGSATKTATASASNKTEKSGSKAEGKKPALGAASENALLYSSPIRALPTELKNRIVRLSHPKQSITALFATLYPASNLRGVRQDVNPVTALDVMKLRGTPAMPMSLSDMAKMIGRSPYPNAQRDLLTNDPKQHPATLHPKIKLLGSESRAEATSYEREQLHVLLESDYSDLESVGKVSGEQEARLITSIDRKFYRLTDDNPNLHDSAAPSTSAVSDAMLLGLSIRLAELKASPKPGLTSVTNVLPSSRYISFNNGPGVPIGPSKAGRFAALCDLLLTVGSLKKSGASQEEVFNTFVNALVEETNLNQRIDLAVHFVNALSEFTKEKVGGSAMQLDHIAMCTFNTIIGNRALSVNKQVDRLANSFSPLQRAYIIGRSAKSLASQSSSIRNAPLEKSQAKKMAAFIDKSQAIAPWRSSPQAAILSSMLEALELPRRRDDYEQMNPLCSAENTTAWAGLLASMPKLNKDSQKKICEGFLKQVEESQLLTHIPAKEFSAGWVAYQTSRMYRAMRVGDLNSCRDICAPAFEQLRRVLPTVQSKSLEQRLNTVLGHYTSLLSEASRQRFLESEG